MNVSATPYSRRHALAGSTLGETVNVQPVTAKKAIYNIKSARFDTATAIGRKVSLQSMSKSDRHMKRRITRSVKVAMSSKMVGAALAK